MHLRFIHTHALIGYVYDKQQIELRHNLLSFEGSTRLGKSDGRGYDHRYFFEVMCGLLVCLDASCIYCYLFYFPSTAGITMATTASHASKSDPPPLSMGRYPEKLVFFHRVLPLGTAYVRVNKFASERGQYEYGKVAHALSAGMRRLLREYLVLIAQLEHQLLKVCVRWVVRVVCRPTPCF